MNAAEARAAAGAESAKSWAQIFHGLELERNELVRRLSSTATAAQYPDVEATLKHCEGFVAQLRSLQVAIKQSLGEQAVLVKLCMETVVSRAEEAAAEETFQSTAKSVQAHVRLQRTQRVATSASNTGKFALCWSVLRRPRAEPRHLRLDFRCPVVACLCHAQLPTCPFEARYARSGIAPFPDPGSPARLCSWILDVLLFPRRAPLAI